ncbi:MAG: NYN domain-containing protein [Chthonomonadales bacterium]|nr:NYN domain-containing protein [Chthonomonadales bacterium]
MSQEPTGSTIAIFLDVENLYIHALQQGLDFKVGPIVEAARKEGRIIFARAYGDFSRPYLAGIKDDLQNSVFEMSLLPTNTKGKNTADVQLALDALEMCLQPAAPTTVVIGSGDRDFVPLVQKIKRYGTFIIGVGLKGSISATLERICDTYWYYEDLQCARLAEIETQPEAAEALDPVERAIRTLLRALATVACEGLQTTGGNVKQAMQQLDPGFKVRELGFSKFTQFLEEAERRGYVSVSSQGMEVLITPSTDASVSDEPEDQELAPDATVEQLRNSYRAVLEGKRVTLLPWNDRKRLVHALWKDLSEAPEGMTIAEMSDRLSLHAAEFGLYVSKQAIYKITYTLNLSRCFRREDVAAFVPDIWEERVFPSCDADEALDRMNVTYLRGIRIDAPGLPLRPMAVAQFLFGDPTDTQLELARQYIRLAEQWRDF